MRILLVDDSALLRRRLHERLQKVDGATVVGEAADVAGAIDAFHRLQPDVVVLDIQMPGGSGMEVLTSIRDARPETVVIMLTNFPLPQLRRRSLACGADYFFDKSCEFDRVAETIRGLRQGTGPIADTGCSC